LATEVALRAGFHSILNHRLHKAASMKITTGSAMIISGN
jgi:hypothetical protein